MSNGRLTDVLVLDHICPDRLGFDEFYYFKVWADEGLTDVIKSVEGVTNVYSILSPNEYDVYIDPRYSIEFLREEIKARIMTREANNE